MGSSPVNRITDFALRQRLIDDGLQSKLDWVFFVLAAVASIWLTWIIASLGLQASPWQIPAWILFWLVLAYLVLPRIHRILSNIYVPNYFIGRARTADGLLGDPINLAFRGSEDELHSAMQAAGWTLADPVSWRSSIRIVTATITRRSYDEAPVSPLFVFGGKEDFAYQQEVDGSPGKRHHVRFWRCPDGWLLPGGTAVDWIAAGSYDRTVGLSAFTLQVTHKIAADTDAERDHIIATIQAVNPVQVNVLRDFSTGYHARNGGGDSIQTDGNLPIVALDTVRVDTARASAAKATTRAVARPISIVLGAVLIWLGALAVLADALSVALQHDSLQAEFHDHDLGSSVVFGLAVLFAVAALFKVFLGWLVFVGSSWVRTLVLVFTALTLLLQLTLAQGGSLNPLEPATGISLATDILTLLALSSEGAAAFVRRRHELNRE